MKIRRILSAVLALCLSLSVFAGCGETAENTDSSAEDTAAAKFEELSQISLDLPTDRVIKVACVGDSITHGTSDESRTHPSYPAYLQDILGNGYEVGNFGLGGTTLMSAFDENGNATIDAAYMSCEWFDKSKDFAPDVVIIMLGTNDSGAYAYKRFDEHFEKDYQTLINAYKALPSNPKIVVATSPYLVGVEHTVNEAIAPYQRELFTRLEGVDGVVDIYDWSEGRYYLYTDGVHYSPEGYYSLAMEFARNIFGLANGYNTYTVKAVPGAVVQLNKKDTGSIVYTYNAVANSDGIAYCYGTAGDYDITVRAEDYARYQGSLSLSESTEIACEMVAGDHNVVLYRPVTASSDTHEKALAENVNDRGDATLWQPKENDSTSAWLLFDLGETKEIHGIAIESWFQAYASGYNVQVSDDGENFTTVATITDGKGNGYDPHFFDSASGRYVKVNFTKKGYMFNYEIYDLQIFSNDERTPSQLELDIIAAEEAEKAANDAANNAAETEEPSALPWIIADIAIILVGAVIIVFLLKKKKAD